MEPAGLSEHLAEPRLLLGDEPGEVGLLHQSRYLLGTEIQITGDGRELVGRQFGYQGLDLLRDLAHLQLVVARSRAGRRRPGRGVWSAALRLRLGSGSER